MTNASRKNSVSIDSLTVFKLDNLSVIHGGNSTIGGDLKMDTNIKGGVLNALSINGGVINVAIGKDSSS